MADPVNIFTSDLFDKWYDDLNDADQEQVQHYLDLLEIQGFTLRHPYSSSITQKSRHGPGLRELRVQSAGRPLRVFYRFDTERSAIVLLGGDKTGVNQTHFYDEAVTICDDAFDVWLSQGRPS